MSAVLEADAVVTAETDPPQTRRYGFGGPSPDERRLEEALEREAGLRAEVEQFRRYQIMVARLETALGERAARLRQLASENEQLRGQVTHHLESERELRVLLLRSQETSSQLVASLETRQLLGPGSIGAHGHAFESLAIGAAQADKPVSAVIGETKNRVGGVQRGDRAVNLR